MFVFPDGQVGDRHGFVDSKADHNPTPPTPLAHRGYAYGLTRFACPSLRRGLLRTVDNLRLPTALAPSLALGKPLGEPCAEGRTGGEATGGLGAARPAAVERPRRGRDALGGE